MTENKFFKLLELPVIYKATQTILAPGGEICLRKKIKYLVKQCAIEHNLLDVGCGPASWLWYEELDPIGLDLSFSYASSFAAHGKKMIVGSAEKIPFDSATFASVWCIGLLHHLNNEMAADTVKEMVRVCRPNGYIFVMDAVLPRKSWQRPVASFIRQMDRGSFMRHQFQLTALLPDKRNWKIKRYTYAATGLEMLECYYKKM